MDTNPDADLDLVKKKAQELMEFFDSVQIFTTKYEGETGLTSSIIHGRGNYFARVGQVSEWLTEQDESTRLEQHEEDE